MITIYGIKNCDTCRKALKWLQAEGIEHRYHDFRADGLEAADVTRWVSAVGWETLLNRRGTTWRKLPPEASGDRHVYLPAPARLTRLHQRRRLLADHQGRRVQGGVRDARHDRGVGDP